MDKDNAEECIRRETEEETGYKISTVEKVFEVYMSPGSVTEIVYFFVAEYTKDMKVNDGGGVADEQENIEVFASSDWAERGFCKKCGSHLFYRLKQANQYIMPAGIFDNGEKLVFDHQIFIEEKPEYYSFANKTHNMTGAEVFAQYAPVSET